MATSVAREARSRRDGLRDDALAAFANRLAKNHRHWSRWARKHGFGAYRIYDRDLPEFPLTVDCYVAEDSAIGTRVLLQEIETGWEATAAQHASWLDAVTRATAQTLALAPAAVVVKLRHKRRGREQHEKSQRSGTELVIVEAGLRFLVDLETYVDTGLFLDHRALRALVRDRAAGKRMLNLFAYTGSFSVYAAAGGAVATDTIDLSNTYLAWARRNFVLNALDPRMHALIRADVRRWLGVARDERRRYDLIVLDAPAFSTSKAMDGVLDIQRDHRDLLDAACALLAPGGELYFSTNLRTFSFDATLAGDRAWVDIGRQTRPEDFRDARVHHAFRFWRRTR